MDEATGVAARSWSGGPGGLVGTITGLVRASVQVAVTYRGRMVLWVLSGFFPLLLMAVWLTVVAQSGPPEGWTAGDFISYYAAATLIWHLSGQHVVWKWDDDMRSGDLSTKLVLPVHPFWQYAADDLGGRLVLGAALVPLLIVASLVVPGLDYSLGPLELLYVALAIALAWVLSVVSASAIALLGFWSTQTTNIWMLWWGVGSFASGWVAPLELMPPWLRDAAVFLPFRYSLGFPAEIMAGRIAGGEIALGFAVGLGWLLGFVAIYALVWPAAVRRYQAVAG